MAAASNCSNLNTSTQSELDFEEFIDEIKGYPCLWNTTLRAYKEQPKRKVAWTAISNKLGKDGEYTTYIK